jgi:uncharacterized coiled-coil DUF342 family protein
MNEHAEKIQIVINTIQDLEIKSTFDNMNRLMGAIQTLAALRDELNRQAHVQEEKTDGHADAE